MRSLKQFLAYILLVIEGLKIGLRRLVGGPSLEKTRVAP
jgi:hypothetical protein